MLKRVELLTASYDFVAVVEVLPFQAHQPPDVVAWGSRIFRRHYLGAEPCFVEAIVAPSATPSPGLPREALRERIA